MDWRNRYLFISRNSSTEISKLFAKRVSFRREQYDIQAYCHIVCTFHKREQSVRLLACVYPIKLIGTNSAEQNVSLT